MEDYEMININRVVWNVSLAAALAFGASAHAGWLTNFSGGSSFGLTDDDPGSLVCALCDSTVNFAAYQNTDGNWADDPAFAAFYDMNDPDNDRIWEFSSTNPSDPSGVVDTAAQYVFFYQVINSYPLDVAIQPLQEYNVTKTDEGGNPVDHQPYRSVGYIQNTVFDNAQNYPDVPLDIPNNWCPGDEGDRATCTSFDPTPIVADDNEPDPSVNPNAGRLSNGREIVSPSINAGRQAYTGALWEFAGLDEIAADATSTVLFLTSDWRYAPNPNDTRPCGVRTVYIDQGAGNPELAVDEDLCDKVGIVWAETESPGGFGAAGDVVGIKNVPEPATLALLSVGLVGLGVTRRRRKTA